MIQFNLLMINDIIMIHIGSVFSNIIVLLFSQVRYITEINIYINNTCVSNVVVCMVAHADNFF